MDQPPPYQAKANVKYNCGCKYSTGKRAEAKNHVERTGHAMSVNGSITPEKGA